MHAAVDDATHSLGKLVRNCGKVVARWLMLDSLNPLTNFPQLAYILANCLTLHSSIWLSSKRGLFDVVTPPDIPHRSVPM
jgi:hypothetical protein